MSCLGRCDVAPAVAVNDRPAPAAATADWSRPPGPAAWAGPGDAAGRTAAAGPGPTTPTPPRRASATGCCGRCCRRPARARTSSRRCKDSGLRGMGGAGLPDRPKWELVAAQPADARSTSSATPTSPSPGTFKDRQILAEQPHLVLEGLLLGMVVVGAEEGWVFIRHEYGPEEAVLRAEIEALRAAGPARRATSLGSGRRLAVEVFISPGGYILGEESALIECMEGHRGEPRNKPPFPGTYGLWGRPTLMNSVETLADVPVIVERGATGGGPGRRRLHRPEVLRRLRARRPARASTACRWAPPSARCWSRPAGWPAAPPSPRCSPAAPRRTSSAPTGSTSGWTSRPWPRPGPCSGPAPWW